MYDYVIIIVHFVRFVNTTFCTIYNQSGDNMFKRIKDLREDNDLTILDLLDKLDYKCTDSAYGHYESGRRKMPIELLIKLSYFYNVSIDYLLNLTDIKTPYPRNIKKSL